MPELPEVETTKVSLAPLLDQRVLDVSIYQSSLRWPIPDNVAVLKGQRLVSLKRRSKYILAEFEHATMLWHLACREALEFVSLMNHLKNMITL